MAQATGSHSYLATTYVADCVGYERAAPNGGEFTNLAAAGAYYSTNPYLDAYDNPDGNTNADCYIHANAPAAADCCPNGYRYSALPCTLKCLRALTAGNRW